MDKGVVSRAPFLSDRLGQALQVTVGAVLPAIAVVVVYSGPLGRAGRAVVSKVVGRVR